MDRFRYIRESKNAGELTAALVRIHSMNPGTSEKQMGETVCSFLENCGAMLEKDPVKPGRNNVIATIPGEKSSPMLVWICHMDTVVIGNGWTRNPLEGRVEDEKIYGRGACDMKSGLACALWVFRKTARMVQEGPISLEYPLRLICTVDEEGDMSGADDGDLWPDTGRLSALCGA